MVRLMTGSKTRSISDEHPLVAVKCCVAVELTTTRRRISLRRMAATMLAVPVEKVSTGLPSERHTESRQHRIRARKDVSNCLLLEDVRLGHRQSRAGDLGKGGGSSGDGNHGVVGIEELGEVK